MALASDNLAATVTLADGTRGVVPFTPPLSANDLALPVVLSDGTLALCAVLAAAQEDAFAIPVALADGTRAVVVPGRDLRQYDRITIDADGWIWGLPSTGVFVERINPATGRAFARAMLSGSDAVNSISADGNGFVWVGRTGGDISKVDVSTGQEDDKYASGLTDIYNVIADANGDVFGDGPGTGGYKLCKVDGATGASLWIVANATGYLLSTCYVDTTNIYAAWDMLRKWNGSGTPQWTVSTPPYTYSHIVGLAADGKLWTQAEQSGTPLLLELNPASGAMIASYAVTNGVWGGYRATDPTGWLVQKVVLGGTPVTPRFWCVRTDSKIAEFDLTARAFVATHDVGAYNDLCVDADGNCWVALQASPYLLKIKPT